MLCFPLPLQTFISKFFFLSYCICIGIVYTLHAQLHTSRFPIQYTLARFPSFLLYFFFLHAQRHYVSTCSAIRGCGIYTRRAILISYLTGIEREVPLENAPGKTLMDPIFEKHPRESRGASAAQRQVETLALENLSPSCTRMAYIYIQPPPVWLLLGKFLLRLSRLVNTRQKLYVYLLMLMVSI